MLAQETKQQLEQYLGLLAKPVVFGMSLGEDERSKELSSFLTEIADMTDKISLEEKNLPLKPSFAIDRDDFESGIVFAGVPLGHEFTSFVLALLQVGGRAPKITEEQAERIKGISKKLDFMTFASLSCTNCPDVVQGFNIMAVLNENISHTMVEGGMFQDLVEEKGIMAVPTVFLNGEEFTSGRQNLDQLLDLVAQPKDSSALNEIEPFDLLVVGGGPAGASSAIYAARKGIRTGIVCKEFGGQVNETLGIENMIGIPYTEGPKLMAEVRNHVEQYPIEIIENQMVSGLEKDGENWKIILESGAVLHSKTVVVATGARWRQIGVPGEDKYRGKGVAYCAHCDGPLFKGKDIAVIGGGNSGVEAAIDLAGIANHVTVMQFSEHLKADNVLQERLKELENVEVIKNAETTELAGDTVIRGLHYKDRVTGEEKSFDVDGVFIQIGLIPDTEWLQGIVDLNERGEIIIDGSGKTSEEGIYAAGDCTTAAYKQIVISMGTGATAALGAYDYLIRRG